VERERASHEQANQQTTRLAIFRIDDTLAAITFVAVSSPFPLIS
jgi:hypothetical protein